MGSLKLISNSNRFKSCTKWWQWHKHTHRHFSRNTPNWGPPNSFQLPTSSNLAQNGGTNIHKDIKIPIFQDTIFGVPQTHSNFQKVQILYEMEVLTYTETSKIPTFKTHSQLGSLKVISTSNKFKSCTKWRHNTYTQTSKVPTFKTNSQLGSLKNHLNYKQDQSFHKMEAQTYTLSIGVPQNHLNFQQHQSLHKMEAQTDIHRDIKIAIFQEKLPQNHLNFQQVQSLHKNGGTNAQ